LVGNLHHVERPWREESSSVSEFIVIRGARENNLKDVSLRIPKGKITRHRAGFDQTRMRGLLGVG
jgi:excinuclease UvrABC ATPase subunit